MRDSIYYSTFILFIIHSYLAMDGCTTINFCKTCQKLFLFKLALIVCGCMVTLNLRELSQQKQTQHLDEDSFDMLYKTDC